MNNFKKLRMKSGLSQEEFRKKFNDQYGRLYTASAISLFENGKRTPETSALLDFADFFGVSLDYLLGRTTFPAKNSFTSSEQETQDLLSLLLRHSPAASEAMKNFRVDASGSILRNGEKVSDLSDPVLLAAAKMIYDRLSEAQAAGASSAHIDITRRP